MMNKINKKDLIITVIISLLPIVYMLFFIEKMPENIAIHFDINNNPDNFVNKYFFVFGFPLFAGVLQTFICIFNDLTDKNKIANKKATKVFKYLLPCILNGVFILTLLYAINIQIDIRKCAMCILGIVFIIVGNYIPKVKNSSTLHCIKFKNEEVENKITRICGYLLIVEGILSIISIFFSKTFSICVIALLFVIVIAMYIYGKTLDIKQ